MSLEDQDMVHHFLLKAARQGIKLDIQVQPFIHIPAPHGMDRFV